MAPRDYRDYRDYRPHFFGLLLLIALGMAVVATSWAERGLALCLVLVSLCQYTFWEYNAEEKQSLQTLNSTCSSISREALLREVDLNSFDILLGACPTSELRGRFKFLKTEIPYAAHLICQLGCCRPHQGVDQALTQWKLYLSYCEVVKKVKDEEVCRSYSSGFVHQAGRDVRGRPLCWIQLANLKASEIPYELAVRNTWLAQDFVIRWNAVNAREGSVSDMPQMLENQLLGLCFVYDCENVGAANLCFDPIKLSRTLIAITTHPSHISRVVVLNAPTIFKATFTMASPFIPTHLKEIVEFVHTNTYHEVCGLAHLPAYLRKSTENEPFTSLMFGVLNEFDLPYRKTTSVLEESHDWGEGLAFMSCGDDSDWP